MKKKYLLLFCTIICFSHLSVADDVDDIENLFEEESSYDESRARREARQAEAQSRVQDAPVTKLENLNQLKPFEDVAVIQKRYLPKTKRFEAHVAAATSVNDDYFTAYGLNASLAYSFTEKFAVEGLVKWFDVSNSGTANDLLEEDIVTNGMVSTELYYGLDLKWTPIYGKFSYFDKKIIPFDHYFSIGVGQTKTVTGASSDASFNVVEADETPFTIHVGTGQTFAMTKWMAFRWDVSYHWYQNTSPLITLKTNGNPVGQSGVKDNFSNIFVSFGLSFYFPEAKYR